MKTKKVKKARRPIDEIMELKLDEIIELSQLVQVMAEEPSIEKAIEGYIMFHF